MDPIRPLVLLNNSNVKWTAAQEKAINRDYPFDLHLETPGQYVIRTYLQFLWLPEVSRVAPNRWSMSPAHHRIPSP